MLNSAVLVYTSLLTLPFAIYIYMFEDVAYNLGGYNPSGGGGSLNKSLLVLEPATSVMSQAINF